MQQNITSQNIIKTPVIPFNGKKILFANVPGDGHFNPLTGIAKHLQAQGYDVRWYSSKLYQQKIQKLEIPMFKFERALEVNGENLEEVFPERSKIKSQVKKLNYDIINFFIARGPEYFADIKEIYKTFQFDLMICDCAFTAIPFVKDLMKIPVLSIGVFPLTETSRDLPPNGLGLTPSNTFIGRIKQSIMRFFADKFLFRKANRVMNNLLTEYDIPKHRGNIFDLLAKKSTMLLQSGTPGFEYKRSDLGKNIRFIGGLLPFNPGNNGKQWYDKRLNQYNRIVLVTQGTVEKDVDKLLVPALEAFRDSNTLVIATTGGSQTKELRVRYPDRNFIIEDFIRFEDVMPYADVYVTNGGYGGVMLAIEHKLPMVVAGVHEGKNEINARIGYFNLGENLKTELPRPHDIRMGVEKVLTDITYKESIAKLCEEFRKYEPYKLASGYVDQMLNPQIAKIAAFSARIMGN